MWLQHKCRKRSKSIFTPVSSGWVSLWIAVINLSSTVMNPLHLMVGFFFFFCRVKLLIQSKYCDLSIFKIYTQHRSFILSSIWTYLLKYHKKTGTLSSVMPFKVGRGWHANETSQTFSELPFVLSMSSLCLEDWFSLSLKVDNWQIIL